ncbi:hypothetical protein MRB53_042347 [Persea americana]|nr:hypothetical protein MRB53_042347 [Persea americana]
MGLISKQPDNIEASLDAIPTKPWHQFLKYMEHLQLLAPAGTTYKLIINGRHGQGFHNVAEDTYGTAAWDDHWSKLDGTGDVVWSDSRLTSLGKQQARDANAFLREQIQDKGLPCPQTYYVSPLIRCLQTADITWSNIDLPADLPFEPVIKEMIREVMGEHTCDRRSSKKVIAELYPQFSIEDGFVENDVLWQADHRETHDEHDVRTRALLNDIFSNDQSTIISFTSHSGSIASLLRVLGHRVFRLETGALIPLLVKAVRKQ